MTRAYLRTSIAVARGVRVGTTTRFPASWLALAAIASALWFLLQVVL